MKIIKRHISDFIILFPIILIFIGEILAFTNPSVASILKVLITAILILPVWLKIRFPNKFLLLVFIFFCFFFTAFVNSFSYRAAIEEGIRYFFPISIILYGYYNRNKLKLFTSFIIVFALLNFIYQFSNYYDYYILEAKQQWFYLQFYSEKADKHFYWPAVTGGIMRATGFVGFFGAYGILNFISFWITYYYYKGKYKKTLLIIFTIGVFISTSFKTIGFFLITIFLKFWYKLKYILLVPIILLIVFIFLSESTKKGIIHSVETRLERYINEGNTARNESYRVMFNEIMSGNLIGEGIGSFGGSASTKYNSPFYDEVSFNWYGLEERLATTDTFFPHLFVEMGLIGGLLYLTLILSPLLIRKKIEKKKFIILLIIYSMLFFDSIFSYSLNNLAILAMTLLFVYPILHHENYEI